MKHPGFHRKLADALVAGKDPRSVSVTPEELDLVREFERLVSEGGKELDITLELRYDCNKGIHKWKWYNGFTDRFHYCDLCPAKDRKRPPPPSRS